MTTARAGLLRRTCRRAGLDRNPMRRREDRVQSWTALLLVTLFLALIPVVAGTLGTSVYHTETVAAQQRLAELRRIDATVVEVGKAPLYAPITPAKVSWVDEHGNTRVAEHRATSLVREGATVSVWLDDGGRVVEPPAETRPLSRAVVLCAAVVFGAFVMFASVYVLLVAALDRRRSRRWEAEWAAVGTIWGGRGAV
ncbi:hypothetical protein IU433_01530 [Nocardia puris]|uniref:Uncharacterized protein n=1 Tax=Nocardia puris TaxID=208602 RepID=A0A366DUX9_9NOCA|nr:hypothetical protein [Nocardia puris]MBF6210467.1 hypothetical protein [Nocardia puris]MBF6367542.1 hypothetical protein [Nocardia puris]MBF6457727.1 hypothetical protein [Nocardia puris]RBO93893.1 hypothetical protein DFR74_102313 [Nocardia puris]